jgi:hypothetical protein
MKAREDRDRRLPIGRERDRQRRGRGCSCVRRRPAAGPIGGVVKGLGAGKALRRDLSEDQSLSSSARRLNRRDPPRCGTSSLVAPIMLLGCVTRPGSSRLRSRRSGATHRVIRRYPVTLPGFTYNTTARPRSVLQPGLQPQDESRWTSHSDRLVDRHRDRPCRTLSDCNGPGPVARQAGRGRQL